MIKIINGDCIEEMKKLSDNSVDSIVTDPPYELGFMGKKWDNTGISNNVDMWKECLRVLKPGGHLLSFGGTRTYHRMACAIEDAGFEIRDMIEWVYSTGFPKSLNIGKAVDKLQGNEREDLGKHPTINGKGDHFTFCANYNGARLTKGTSKFEGWGTALKPAHEPIVMARKPISDKTIVENCLKWGTGGINVDGSRVGSETIMTNMKNTKGGLYNLGNDERTNEVENIFNQGRFPANLIHDDSEEVRDCFPDSKSTSSVWKGFSGEGSNEGWKRKSHIKEISGGFDDSGNASRYFKSIIYQPKASKKERNLGLEDLDDKIIGNNKGHGLNRICGGCGVSMLKPDECKCDKPNWVLPSRKNNHPTVKPLALMEYLIKMITPPNGVVLDPFMGSGSTGVAAIKNGFDFIGIDLDESYCEIAEKRIKYNA